MSLGSIGSAIAGVARRREKAVAWAKSFSMIGVGGDLVVRWVLALTPEQDLGQCKLEAFRIYPNDPPGYFDQPAHHYATRYLLVWKRRVTSTQTIPVLASG